jgi:alpha-glucosidase
LQLTLEDQHENEWFDSVSNQTNQSAYDLPFIPGFWE